MEKGAVRGLGFFSLAGILEGIAALIFLMLHPSEEGAVLLGYSPARLGLIVLALLPLAGLVVLAAIVWRDAGIARRILDWLKLWINPRRFVLPAAVLAWVTLITIGMIAFNGGWPRLGNAGAALGRAWPLLAWLALLLTQAMVCLGGFPPASPAGWESLATLVMSSAVPVYIFFNIIQRGSGLNFTDLKRFLAMQIAPNLSWLVIVLAAVAAANRLIHGRPGAKNAAWSLLPAGMTVFLAAWFVYQLTTLIVHWYNRELGQVYFPDLAAAFLHGKTYLEHPSSIIDLTPYNGKYYVAFPPLAALLMLPQVAVWGAASVNPINFSIVYASLNVGLVFMILERINQLGWVKIGRRGSLWLAALFGLSTPHWQLAISGEVWYLSQILTVTFVALAVWLAVSDAPAALVGLGLGLSMLARPLIILSWPLLLGIFWQRQMDRNREVRVRRLVEWSAWTAVPIAFMVGGLLWYNAIRFGSLFDFGYSNMPLSPIFASNLKTYGQFSLHFIPRNLNVILFLLPHWEASCGFFTSDILGMSVLVTTPALFYLIRAGGKRPWVLGAWLASGLLLIPLILYFNTGLFQFGYRYLLDLIVPVIMLIAVAVRKERLSLTMKALILAGLLVNYWGLWWFFRHWCR